MLHSIPSLNTTLIHGAVCEIFRTVSPVRRVVTVLLAASLLDKRSVVVFRVFSVAERLVKHCSSSSVAKILFMYLSIMNTSKSYFIV